jgi:hypothetical protein
MIYPLTHKVLPPRILRSSPAQLRIVERRFINIFALVCHRRIQLSFYEPVRNATPDAAL